METAEKWSHPNVDGMRTKRRLLWHGTLIFVFGLLAGAAVPVVANPRMGVAAHVGGVMSGMFLMLIGLIWEEIRLPPTGARTLAAKESARNPIRASRVLGNFESCQSVLAAAAPRIGSG